MLTFLKRIPLLLIPVLFARLETQSQNLVINGSFEEFTECPELGSVVDVCTGWFKTRITPDYYHSCDNDDVNLFNSQGVPINTLGYQFASEGEGYFGQLFFGTFDNSYIPNFNEFSTGSLTSEMVLGLKYDVNFKVSLANDSPLAVDHLGIKFTTEIPYWFQYSSPLTNSAHVYTEEIITDSVGWTTISGSFIADSAYRYLTIGNHFMDNLCDTLQLFDDFVGAYYFIDEVSVVPSPDYILVDADTSLCVGSQASFFAYGPFLGWSLPNDPQGIFSTEPGLNFIATEPGSYIANYADTTIVISYTIQIPEEISLGDDLVICDGQNIILEPFPSGDNYLWSDGSAEYALNIDSPGTYWVQVIDGACVDADTITVFDFPDGIVDLPNSLVYCNGVEMSLEVPATGYPVIWQDGSIENEYSITATGTYWATVSSGDCVSSDTCQVVAFPSVPINLGPNTSICEGQSFVLDTPNITADFIWQDGSTAETFLVNQPGTYWVTANYYDCSASDTIVVNDFPEEIVSFPPTGAICSGEPYILTLPDTDYDIEWSDGSSGQQLIITEPGTYSATVSFEDCISTDQIVVGESVYADVDLGPDTSLCDGETLLLNAGNQGFFYEWHDGSNQQTITIDSPTEVILAVSLAGCTARDTMIVDYHPIQNLVITGDQTVCIWETQELMLAGDWLTALWNTGAQTLTLPISSPGYYSVIATDYCSEQSDDITIADENCDCKPTLPTVIDPSWQGDLIQTSEFNCILAEFELRIYNALGKLVAITSDNQWTWTKPSQLAFGVYIFSFHYTVQGETTPREFVQKVLVAERIRN